MFSVSFYNRFFYPDISATSQILTELVLGLRDRGINIDVICSDASYLGGKIKLDNSEIEGISIKRLSSTSLGRKRKFYRYIDFFSYLSLSATNILFDKSDILVFFTDPPFLNILGSLLGSIKGKKKVVVLQDFFPYAAMAVNLINDGLLFNLFDKQTVFSLNLSEKVVVLSERMAEFAISKGVRGEKIVVIHNWADKDLIQREERKDKIFLEKYGLKEEDFVILYSGNLGLGHEFDTILDVVSELNDVILLFVGDGPSCEYVRNRALKANLNNVRFYPYVDKGKLSLSLSVADVHLITQLPDVVGINMPSKLYGCMASGRPICYIGSMDSDVASIINNARCGRAFNIGDKYSIIDFINFLKSEPAHREHMGIKAREYFVKHFDKEIGINKYYDLLNDVYNS